MNHLDQRKVTIYDALLLKIISCNSHNRISATYVRYPFKHVKFVCKHAKHHQSSNTVTISGSVTGVICRVLTPKDKERHASTPLQEKAILFVT